MSSALDGSSKGITFFQWMILGTLTLTSTLYAMSMTIANIALPQLQGALGATPVSYTHLTLPTNTVV